jgi:hypothetical protein
MQIKVGGFYFLKNGDIIEVFSADMPSDKQILAVLYNTTGWQAMRYHANGTLSTLHTCALDMATSAKGDFLEVDRQTLQKLRAYGRIPKRQRRRRAVELPRMSGSGNGRSYVDRSKN